MKDNKVVLNVGRGFPAEEGFLAFNKQSGKEAAHCWAKPNLHNNAFTLIELLVVVLIIGILAAVALPQYKMAVAKSRMTQLRVRANALYKAAQVYKLQNGVWPIDVRDLDIDIVQEATEFKKSDLTTADHIAAFYEDESVCGVHVAPNGNQSAWCFNEDLIVTNIKDVWRCVGKSALGKKICASMP